MDSFKEDRFILTVGDCVGCVCVNSNYFSSASISRVIFTQKQDTSLHLDRYAIFERPMIKPIVKVMKNDQNTASNVFVSMKYKNIIYLGNIKNNNNICGFSINEHNSTADNYERLAINRARRRHSKSKNIY